MTQPHENPIADHGHSTDCNIGSLPDHQIAAIEKFVKQVGGVENARCALDELAKLQKAA